jgi:UDP-N-acetylglucosamine 2-epimerase
MQPGRAGDAGFPAPTLTLLFDRYAEQHLRQAGHYPGEGLRVTGSPRLDAMMAALASFSTESLETTRREIGVREGDAFVLVTTKERQARHVLPALIAAAEALPGVTLVIKPHPAETADAYAAAVAGQQRVRVASAAAPLAPLIAASRAVVTVNSTVALDAAVAGIPALVIGLPNNLSPFVDAGVLAGAASSDIGQQLERILYDEGFRQQLSAARSSFLRRYAIVSTGTAAARSAAAVVELMRHGCGWPGKGI